MNTYFRFIGFAVMSLLGWQEMNGAGDRDRAPFIMLKHIGSEDKPVPILVISSDPSYLHIFEDPFWSKLHRVHIVTPDEYGKLKQFLSVQAEKFGQTPLSRKEASAFGTFEISERTEEQTVKSFSFVTSRRSTLVLGKRVLSLVVDEKIGKDLAVDLKEILSEIRFPDEVAL